MAEEREFNSTKLTYQYPITINRYIVNLDSYIDSPDNYREVFDTLIKAEQDESIFLNINSCGGRMDTTREFISLLLNTNASTRATIFTASSAAALIALSCDEIQVAQTGAMMIHNSSFGTEGKVGDIKSQSDHIDKMSRSLFELVLKGFLTKEEIEEVCIGKEFYFDYKQIVKRMKKFVPIRLREPEGK